MAVIIAFDYGLKRIGVAIASDSNVIALTTLQSDDLWVKIKELIAEHKPAKLVVGLPRNLSGENTNQTKLAQQFGSKLGEITGLPIEWQDEAMSTERALERIGTKTTIAERKKLLDQVAAQIILEDYLA